MTPDELAAAQQEAQQAQADRISQLRARGWQRHVPITRREIADWTLDRWILRNNARRVN